MQRTLVVIVVIVVMASGSTAQSEPAPDSGKGYIAFGAAAIGGTDLYTAASLDIGYRPGPYDLWIHVVLQQGSMVGDIAGQEGSDDKVTSSSHFAVRAGVDKRGCLDGEVWCAFAGIDIGYLHEYAISKANPRDLRGPVVVPHVGFDFGGHIRFRPSFDASVAHGVETVGLTAAIAFQW